MKKTILKLISFGLTASIIGCSPKSDSARTVDHASQTIEQNRQEVALATDQASKSAREADDAVRAAMDTVSGGGQPGRISLSGGLVAQNGDRVAVDPRILLSLHAGVGWRGYTPTLSSNILSLKIEMSASEMGEIDKLKDNDNFVSVGCDETITQADSSPLRQSKIVTTDDNSLQVIKANTVFICDASQLSAPIVLVDARRVIFHSFRLTLTGSIWKMFAVSADELILDGDSSLQSNGVDGSSTLLSGPTISLSATALSGAGTLKIEANGSNYRKGAQP